MLKSWFKTLFGESILFVWLRNRLNGWPGSTSRQEGVAVLVPSVLRRSQSLNVPGREQQSLLDMKVHKLLAKVQTSLSYYLWWCSIQERCLNLQFQFLAGMHFYPQVSKSIRSEVPRTVRWQGNEPSFTYCTASCRVFSWWCCTVGLNSALVGKSFILEILPVQWLPKFFCGNSALWKYGLSKNILLIFYPIYLSTQKNL